MRHPAFAGMFYPFDKRVLLEQLEEMFSGISMSNKYSAVISPHAGYPYSGKTAAHAISQLKQFQTYIILGPNHTGIGQPFSLMKDKAWRTPIGDVPLNKEIAEKLMELSFIKNDALAHKEEHSIEVQLPLMIKRLGKFLFVPINIMNMGYDGEFQNQCRELGQKIAEIIQTNNMGIVASSDFSHYITAEKAEEVDGKVIQKILKLDIEGYFKTMEEEQASICGFGPIAVLMETAKAMNWQVQKIHYSHSGMVTGDTEAVVAYYAIGFY